LDIVRRSEKGNIKFPNYTKDDEGRGLSLLISLHWYPMSIPIGTKRITHLTLGTKDRWEGVYVFEAVLMWKLGVDRYKGLWPGKIKWSDSKVTDALETFKKMLTYVNLDYSTCTRDEACALMVEGKAAMNILGHWAVGYFYAKGFKDFGWT
jgi:glucose/mannose transport system substrate-binding protein